MGVERPAQRLEKGGETDEIDTLRGAGKHAGEDDAIFESEAGSVRGLGPVRQHGPTAIRGAGDIDGVEGEQGPPGGGEIAECAIEVGLGEEQRGRQETG